LNNDGTEAMFTKATSAMPSTATLSSSRSGCCTVFTGHRHSLRNADQKQNNNGEMNNNNERRTPSASGSTASSCSNSCTYVCRRVRTDLEIDKDADLEHVAGASVGARLHRQARISADRNRPMMMERINESTND
jgi:hypothetical protein